MQTSKRVHENALRC